MKVLVTGHDGYIGCVMTPLLTAAGHEVVGLDTGLFRAFTLGEDAPAVATIAKDLRDVEPHDLDGLDAVIHLAAISNDPVGNLNPELTFDINHRASVRLAETAKQAHVPRFLYSSSCSTYGAAEGDDRRRRALRRSTPSPPTAAPRCWPSATSPRSPTTTSAPSTCATPPPTASPPACAATS